MTTISPLRRVVSTPIPEAPSTVARAGGREQPVIAEIAAASTGATGAAEASSTVANASVGGRAPASATFLAALGVGNAAATTVSGEATILAAQADLGVARAELTAVHDQIDATKKTLDQLQLQITNGIKEAQREQNNLNDLERRLTSARNKRAAVGGAATVLGFLLGGPLGAIAGNAAGFATLKLVDDLDRQIKSKRVDISNAGTKLTNLRNRQTTLTGDRKKLDARAAELETKDAALTERLKNTEASTDLTTRLSGLTAARRGTIGLIKDAKALLLDYAKLAARAATLGVDVEKLREELVSEVAKLELFVASVERALEAAMFDLAFAAIGAGAGIGLLTAAEAKALKTALNIVRVVNEPTAARVKRLAIALTSTILPADATAAEKIAAAVVATLAADIATDRTDVETLLADIGETALNEAQKAWLKEFVSLPGNIPVLPLVKAMIALSDDERGAAAAIFKALASVRPTAPTAAVE